MGLFFLAQKADTLCPSDNVAFSQRSPLYHQSHSILCVQKHRGHVKVTKLKADSFQVISVSSMRGSFCGDSGTGQGTAGSLALSEITDDSLQSQLLPV